MESFSRLPAKYVSHVPVQQRTAPQPPDPPSLPGHMSERGAAAPARSSRTRWRPSARCR